MAHRRRRVRAASPRSPARRPAAARWIPPGRRPRRPRRVRRPPTPPDRRARASPRVGSGPRARRGPEAGPPARPPARARAPAPARTPRPGPLRRPPMRRPRHRHHTPPPPAAPQRAPQPPSPCRRRPRSHPTHDPRHSPRGTRTTTESGGPNARARGRRRPAQTRLATSEDVIAAPRSNLDLRITSPGASPPERGRACRRTRSAHGQVRYRCRRSAQPDPPVGCRRGRRRDYSESNPSRRGLLRDPQVNQARSGVPGALPTTRPRPGTTPRTHTSQPQPPAGATRSIRRAPTVAAPVQPGSRRQRPVAPAGEHRATPRTRYGNMPPTHWRGRVSIGGVGAASVQPHRRREPRGRRPYGLEPEPPPPHRAPRRPGRSRRDSRGCSSGRTNVSGH